MDVSNPPEKLTPDSDGKSSHPCINLELLQKSDLWANHIHPLLPKPKNESIDPNLAVDKSQALAVKDSTAQMAKFANILDHSKGDSENVNNIS